MKHEAQKHGTHAVGYSIWIEATAVLYIGDKHAYASLTMIANIVPQPSAYVPQIKTKVELDLIDRTIDASIN